MTATNDITGDAIITKGSNENYRDGWDRIFKKPVQDEPKEQEQDVVDSPQNSD